MGEKSRGFAWDGRKGQCHSDCIHYEPLSTPGTNECLGCRRGYLRMPDKYEPRPEVEKP